MVNCQEIKATIKNFQEEKTKVLKEFVASIHSIKEYELKSEEIQNRIKVLEKELLDNNCSEIKSNSFFFYIFVNNKQQIKTNTPPAIFSLFKDNRYNDNLEDWRPFEVHNKISDLLEPILKIHPQIKPIYITKDLNSHLINIEDEIHNSIIIFDIFSINKDNEKIALKFDTKKAGVIIPVCRKLNKKLIDYSDKILDKFIILNQHINEYIPCEIFAFDIPSEKSFKHNIIKMIKHKILPVNKTVKNAEKIPEL